jgi:hypothetical protein
VIKFKVTSDRFAEACNVIEYINASAKIVDTAVRILPRFVLDDEGQYIVKVTLDEDGDIQSFEGMDAAFAKLAAITPRRLEKLIKELSEAAKAIVNPPNGTG